MKTDSKGGFTSRNHMKLVHGGADYFRLVQQIIDQAQYTLHFQTYIFDEDETGTLVAEALKHAAQRGVAVYLLPDGYASRGLSVQFIGGLKEAGVHFGFFKPLFKSDFFYLGRRLHHKVIVADARVSMVAGVNVSNRYNDIGDVKAWLDWAIYAEGEVAGQLHQVCQRMWNRSVFREKCPVHTALHPVAWPQERCSIRVRRNDWVYKKTEITRSYRDLFRHAQKEVTVMTGYFWPPQKLLRQMARAARRGVRIRLILTAKADVPLSKYTERYLYDFLFRNQVEVYEYQKNILHGKIAVCDHHWILAGSYNMNNLSAFASVELNLEIKNAYHGAQLNHELLSIIQNDCRQIRSEDFFASVSLLQRFFYFLSYKTTHILFFLFTFYFRQRSQRDH